MITQEIFLLNAANQMRNVIILIESLLKKGIDKSEPNKAYVDYCLKKAGKVHRLDLSPFFVEGSHIDLAKIKKIVNKEWKILMRIDHAEGIYNPNTTCDTVKIINHLTSIRWLYKSKGNYSELFFAERYHDDLV